MPEFKDYYKILGVGRNADQKTISQAYRRLARQYHPDVNPGDKAAEEKFKEINEAYQVLSDPEKRARYDQMYDYYARGGVDWQEVFRRGRTYRAPTGEWTIFGDLGDLFEGPFAGFSDFFREFFADLGERVRAHPGWGEPLEAEVEITLEEAFRGTRRRLEVRADGSTYPIEVSIPPGVHDGDRVRVSVPRIGELYAKVRIKPHPLFERKGDDLYIEVPVTLAEAVLGAEIEVPTLDGKVTMRVPPETQNGQVFRLKGLGMPKKQGGRGDELVRIKVVLPTKLSPREREALAETLRRLKQENPRAPLGCR